MPEIFIKLIEQLNSSVFILLGILIITGYVLYKLGIWTQKFSDHDKRVEKIENISEKVITLATKVDLIYQSVNPNTPVRSNSPISLTDVGEQIVKNLDANNIFQRYAEKLILEVEKMGPNNAYDIQKCSFEVAKSKMINMLEETELSKVKKEAFNFGLLVEDVMSIFGILLRNYILKQRNISIAEVDKYTPSSNS